MQLYGAIHRPAPPAIRPLFARASLQRMAVPTSADWHAACPPDSDALGNDTRGNCVPCSELRAIQMRRANAMGDSWRPTTAMSIALYTALTGYNPITGRPDIGTPTDEAMAAWCRTGIQVNSQDTDLIRWVTVDPANDDHIAIAIAHTGPVQVTLALPSAAGDPAMWGMAPGTGAAWVPGSLAYHRVPSGKFLGRTRTIRTYGIDQDIHPEFWSRYVVAVDATLSREWFSATGLAPSGLDWDALNSDMEALAA